MLLEKLEAEYKRKRQGAHTLLCEDPDSNGMESPITSLSLKF